MPNELRHTHAIVRGVAATFDDCIKPQGEVGAVDLGRARGQHAAYCALFEKLGLVLRRLDADDRHPDCCFVEDTAIVAADWGVVCEMAEASRRGEERAVVEALSGRRLHRLQPPATIDGGDAIVHGDTMFVGLTARTNQAAVRQLDAILATEGVAVVPVPVEGVLHLKSACTPIAPGLFLVSEALAGAEAFADCEKLVVPRDESYAANCLSVNGTVVVTDGFPRTGELIASRGFPVESLSMTEFRKCGGSLTCLSILM
jgi:dimethylargininase